MQSTGQPYGAIGNGAIGCRGGRIAFVGPDADASGHDATEVIDCGGRWITPGLIDCHTHLVYGGDRAAEFELRLEGASYEQIARAGGGILSTVTATRNADEDALGRGHPCRAWTRCWPKASRPSRSSPATGWKPPPRSASFAPRAARL